ncbi:hypothetical protein [Desulfoluna spongiiphila]|uniref:hypothetical protein n=1 Tax=Desulfoluna spongiiphila TaxID=419481 RepID=UPI0012591CBC|nr:hypothetical protein [Desulfoluna spongiiphila]VVS95364.1 hypothetical protein DBB_49410 [Desulfoluna spongiiphila]
MKPLKLKPLSLEPLALRPLGYDDYNSTRYLIRNGFPCGASYFCNTPLMLDGGQTFPVNVPPRVGERFLHHGGDTNEVAVIDLFSGDTKSGVTNTGEKVWINGYEVTKFAIAPGRYAGHNTGTYDGFTTADYWIWSNRACEIEIRGGGNSRYQNVRVPLLEGLNPVKTATLNVSEIRRVFIDNRYTLVPDLKIAAIAQLTRTAYSINPIYIPTAGAPTTIDTAAASAADLNGLTWDLTLPANKWAWDLLDGLPSVEIIEAAYRTDFSLWSHQSNVTTEQVQEGWKYSISESSGRAVIYTGAPTGIRVENSLSITPLVDTRIYMRISETSFDLLGTEKREIITRGEVDDNIHFFDTSGQTGDRFILHRASAKQLLPASGLLKINDTIIKPTLTQWQTIINKLNLISRGDGSAFLYVDNAGYLSATDGVNTCRSATPYTADTPFGAVLLFSDDGQMRIDMDGVMGTPTAFKGTFLDGSAVLKFGLDNEDIVMPGSILGRQGLKTLPTTAFRA